MTSLQESIPSIQVASELGSHSFHSVIFMCLFQFENLIKIITKKKKLMTLKGRFLKTFRDDSRKNVESTLKTLIV